MMFFRKYPKCSTCGAKMSKFDGVAWYTCPECGNAIRKNSDGTWSLKSDLFKSGKKKHTSDFDLADFCRGGDLTED